MLSALCITFCTCLHIIEEAANRKER